MGNGKCHAISCWLAISLFIERRKDTCPAGAPAPVSHLCSVLAGECTKLEQPRIPNQGGRFREHVPQALASYE